MGKIHLICNEIRTAELNKIQGFVDVYKAVSDLIKTLECELHPAGLPSNTINELKKLVRPYEKIYLLVGDSQDEYVKELGLNFTEQDDSDEIAKKLANFVSHPIFYQTRNAAAAACGSYVTLSKLYRSIMAKFNCFELINTFEASQIKCVQLFSQFGLLGKTLKDEVDNVEIQEADKLTAVTHSISSIWELGLEYANLLLSNVDNSDKSIDFVANNVIPELDFNLKEYNEKISKVEEELNRIRLMGNLDQAFEVREKLLANNNILDQNSISEWIHAYPDSQLNSNDFNFLKDNVILLREFESLETDLENNKKLINEKSAQLHQFKIIHKQLEDSCRKFDPKITNCLANLNKEQDKFREYVKNNYDFKTNKLKSKAEYIPSVLVISQPEPIILTPPVDIQSPKIKKLKLRAFSFTTKVKQQKQEKFPKVDSDDIAESTTRRQSFFSPGVKKGSKSQSAPSSPQTPKSNIQRKIEELEACGGIKFTKPATHK
ncbi:MAG: hypothetical protein Q8M40_13535 [Legionella sp.]|nr:hypothetical protein [Legionella sp.]